jgi:hypothetical protein
MLARLNTHQRWVPLIAGFAWWGTFHPGFISEDSLITLTDVRSGAISVWLTAWWAYVVKALTLDLHLIPLMTLISVLALEYAVYFWIVTVLPRTPARTIAVLLIALSPIVGGMGIQIRHDVALGAGLLICAAVLTRSWSMPKFSLRDAVPLLLTAPLLAARHNGVPTIAAAAILVLLARRWRQATALLAVAVLGSAITYGATRTSGNSATMDPIQTVEWLMGDISCLLGNGAQPTESEWATLTRIAGRESWPQTRACRVMNPILLERKANATAIVVNYRELVGVWRSLAFRYPMGMIAAHAERVRLFLPPFPPFDVPSFLHSTIVPNDLGLAWTFPSVAERARIVVRAWNAMGVVLANSMIWLVVLIVTAWRQPSWRDRLIPTIVIAVALNLGLLVAAPISEGRYGLVILICGQATALYLVLERVMSVRHRVEQDVDAGGIRVG